jgi:hypothetical protein
MQFDCFQMRRYQANVHDVDKIGRAVYTCSPDRRERERENTVNNQQVFEFAETVEGVAVMRLA